MLSFEMGLIRKVSVAYETVDSYESRGFNSPTEIRESDIQRYSYAKGVSKATGFLGNEDIVGYALESCSSYLVEREMMLNSHVSRNTILESKDWYAYTAEWQFVTGFYETLKSISLREMESTDSFTPLQKPKYVVNPPNGFLGDLMKALIERGKRNDYLFESIPVVSATQGVLVFC